MSIGGRSILWRLKTTTFLTKLYQPLYQESVLHRYFYTLGCIMNIKCNALNDLNCQQMSSISMGRSGLLKDEVVVIFPI